MPILATKLYIPRQRAQLVPRSGLIERLNQGLERRLTLISAPAGFGKTTLLSAWVEDLRLNAAKRGENAPGVAWVSLDAGDGDPARFLTYLIAALQTVAAHAGERALTALQSPQPPLAESVLTELLNEIAAVRDDFVLVLDDYHTVDAEAVDRALAFLLERLPPHMHLVIATREDPSLPLARLRARGQLAELRITDLRFSAAEAAGFLNDVMSLHLSTEDIDALETRTEGWIAGLQLAAISMQGRHDAAAFIQSFTGSHHFVLDYLAEEVLQRQPEKVQAFLLKTSILDRMCAPLCDAVLGRQAQDEKDDPSPDIASLEQANLFIFPLDNERYWYRYHHLFADFLRQRLRQSLAARTGHAEDDLNELHRRASQWYEDNGLEIEAFHHAAAAHDIERAERLIKGPGMPLHLRGAMTAILDWLGSLPANVLNARPSLWLEYGALSLVVGQTTGVDEKLDAAEAGLPATAADSGSRWLIGRIATTRAVLALTRYQAEAMIVQSRRALEYLEPDNLSLRAIANWTLGYAYLFQGDREAARPALTEAVSLSQAGGDIFNIILATTGLGYLQEMDNQLHAAAETYGRVLQMAGDQPLQIVYEACLGLARIHYEWNDLEAADRYGQQALHLAQLYDRVVDRFIVCEVFLARLKLAHGDVTGAGRLLAKIRQSARRQNFAERAPEVAAAQVTILLRQGNLAAAAELASTHSLPLSQVRVHLAQGDAPAALAILEPFRHQVEAKGWQDERLRAMLLQAVALHNLGEKARAGQALDDTLALAEAGGFVRLFVDEGVPLAEMLSEAAERGVSADYVGKLLAAFERQEQDSGQTGESASAGQAWPVEPLSRRELEVLQLIALGLSNREIGERLFLALSTVKGHSRAIFDKLQVQRRTEAVARARELGLL